MISLDSFVAVGGAVVSNDIGGLSVTLDGVNDYVNLNGIIADLVGKSFSVKATIIPNANIAGSDALFGIHDSSGGNKLVLKNGELANTFVSDTFPNILLANVQTNIELRFDFVTKQVVLLKDNVVFYDAVKNDVVVGATDTFTLGAEYDGSILGDFFGGTIQDFVVTDLDATTATEAQADADAQAAIDAERILIDSIRLKARLGKSLTLHEALTLFLSDSVEAQTAVDALNSGFGYDDLLTLGLTPTEASRAIAIFYMQIDPTRYESEQALQAIKADPALIVPFKTWLEGLPTPLALPDMEGYLVALRSDLGVYNEARAWFAQYVPS